MSLEDAATQAYWIAHECETNHPAKPEDLRDIELIDKIHKIFRTAMADMLREMADSDVIPNMCDPYGGTTGSVVQEWLLDRAEEMSWDLAENPTLIVFKAMRAAFGESKISSLQAALVTENLLQAGCTLGGVTRAQG